MAADARARKRATPRSLDAGSHSRHRFDRPRGAGAPRGRIAADLHLTDAEMGLVFSAYATAYAICEVPSGFLGDRFGPRPVLMRIAIWWSVFMAATAAAFSFVSLYLSQLLFGAGEAGCYPNVARLFSRWLNHAQTVGRRASCG